MTDDDTPEAPGCALVVVLAAAVALVGVLLVGGAYGLARAVLAVAP